MENGFVSKRTYILDANKNPVAQPDGVAWTAWLDWAAEVGWSVVAQEEIGGSWISTVFLGFNMNHRGDRDPILFETVVFRKDGAEYVRRYRTWKEAEQGHLDLAGVAAVFASYQGEVREDRTPLREGAISE
jgi:hypothetical protein